jgi:hypothetical protein
MPSTEKRAAAFQRARTDLKALLAATNATQASIIKSALDRIAELAALGVPLPERCPLRHICPEGRQRERERREKAEG